MASIGFEEKLWQAADKLRGSMDASEYKSVVLGLIFLKYVSDAFEEKHAELADLSQYTINKLNNSGTVTTETLAKICIVLNCDVGDICEVVAA